eukprot:gene9029-8693_t
MFIAHACALQIAGPVFYFYTDPPEVCPAARPAAGGRPAPPRPRPPPPRDPP